MAICVQLVFFISSIFCLHGICQAIGSPQQRAAPVKFVADSLQCLPTTLGNDTCKEYYFADSVNPMSWDDARVYCDSLSEFLGYPLDLVAIETKHENDVLKDYISRNYVSVQFWTCGYDTSRNKDFVWASTGYIVIFYDWLSGQPEYGERNEDRIYIQRFSNGVMGWGDLQGSQLNYPLCERVGVN